MEAPFGRMAEEFESLFNRLVNWPMIGTAEEINPRGLSMEERENEVVVRAELPGFTPEEVRVEMLGEQLTIEAVHKEPAEGERPERETHRARRLVTLPAGIAPEKVEATFRNGVLEVHLPRTPETTARRIEVKT
jgi:HSP20 family protein